jgi:hypothetical protein
MDINLALSAVGYGSVRMLRERAFSTDPFALPASWILKTPDPVRFCLEALETEHPEWIEDVDDETRRAIHARLRDEARRASPRHS